MIRAYVTSDLSGLDRLERGLNMSVENVAKEGAEMVIRDIRASWSPQSPSPVGAAPAVVSGDLDASLRQKPSKRNSKGQFARDGAWYAIEANPIHKGFSYAGVLENPEYNPKKSLNRPFLLPALLRTAPMYFSSFKRILRAK